ncbi:MAG: hypothetical protein Q9162_001259 [Coniocarpon cinnabarinum]
MAGRFQATYQKWLRTAEHADKRAAWDNLPRSLVNSLEGEYCFGLGSMDRAKGWTMDPREEVMYYQLAMMIDDLCFFIEEREMARRNQSPPFRDRPVRPFQLYAQDPAFTPRDRELLEHLGIQVSTSSTELFLGLNAKAVFFAPYLEPSVDTAWIFRSDLMRPGVVVSTLVLDEEAIARYHPAYRERYQKKVVEPVVENYNEVNLPSWRSHRTTYCGSGSLEIAMWNMRMWVRRDTQDG